MYSVHVSKSTSQDTFVSFIYYNLFNDNKHNVLQ